MTDTTTIAERFLGYCEEANVQLVSSVPDGYLVPLIDSLDGSDIIHVPTAREEECLGIASGAAMSGQRSLVMVQNSGFLNSIGCFGTLCMNYKLPIVFLVAHRGNFFDRNGYDTEKYRYFEAFLKNTEAFHVSWYQFREEGNLIKRSFEHAEAASEPVLLSSTAIIEEIAQITPFCNISFAFPLLKCG